MRLQITQELEKLQEISTHASNLATLTFINKNLKDFSYNLESRHVSSQLGLDHPSANPFHVVQDGFGHTIHRQRDLIECMNVRRRSSISRRMPMFPPLPQNRKRRNWFDDLDRENE